MQINPEIKWSRLVMALLVTVVIADTVPHPNLSPGFLHNLAVKLADKFSVPLKDSFSVR